MDEGIAIRAITIGASVLIAIATMSGVIAYYTIARDMARSIGTGVNIAQLYTESIRNTLLKSEANGSDIKNLINYFYEDKTTNITIENMDIFENKFDSEKVTKIKPITNINNPNDKNSKEVYLKIMKFLMPNQLFALTYELDKDNILEVKIRNK